MIMRTCLLALCAPMFLSCSTAHEWDEVQSGPATRAEVFDALVEVARTDGFTPGPETDRGLGIWESRWRHRHLGLGRPGRFRLRAELMIDEGSAGEGWLVRYLIEQQKVDDLRRAQNPIEADWEDDGQDSERMYLFGERLRRQLHPETARIGAPEAVGGR